MTASTSPLRKLGRRTLLASCAALALACSSGSNAPSGSASSGGSAGSQGQGGASGGAAVGGQSGSAGSVSSSGGSAGSAGSVSSSGGSAGSIGSGGSGGTTTLPTTRVVGYIPDWAESFSQWATTLDFSQITHINVAFANPVGDSHAIDIGQEDADLAALVAAAHQHGVKVLASVGGISASPDFAPHYAPGSVDAFVQGHVDFMTKHQLDGIDVDVEYPEGMGANYGAFIQKLEAALGPDKLLTAAVAQWVQDGMPDDALGRFDFINVMSYDQCGGWTDACPHSSYQGALDDLDYYANVKQVPKDRIVLGVPFYGYCWGASCPDDYVLYKDILIANDSAWQSDTFQADGATWWYNGDATLQQKAELSKAYGGVMIWELSGDASGERSLLKVLNDAL
jgi:chitinase